MKNRFTFLFAFCLMALNASSQVVDVVNGVPDATGLALEGNNLYISNYLYGQILVADISQPNPTATVVASGLGNATGIILLGNDLFVAQESGEVLKFDISQSPLVSTNVTSGLGGAYGLSAYGDDLYISGFSSLYKIDLSQPFPQTPSVVNTSISEVATNMVIYEGEVFYLTFDGALRKFNLTDTNPTPSTLLTGLSTPLAMTLNGSFLYISENFGNKIIRINLKDSTPMSEDIVTGLSRPRFSIFESGKMYFAQGGSGKVSTIILPPILSSINVCTNSNTDNLGGASPSGGVYSGTNITDNGNGETYAFDVAIAGIGTHEVTYTVNGQSTTSTIEVVAGPTVTFTPPASVLIDAGSQALTGSPAGGTFTGPGVTGDSFDPVAAGLGTHTITYTYTDGNGCSGMASGTITVNPNLPADNACGGANDLNTSFGGAFNEPQVTSLWDNTGYTSAGDPTTGIDCFYGGDGLQNTIWYSFMGDGNAYRIRSVQCAATNYNSDTQVAIYSGSCSNLTPVACSEDEDGGAGILNISVDVTTEIGVTYYMLIDGFNGGVGEYCLEVTNLTPNAVTNIQQTDIQLFPNPTTGEIQLNNVEAEQVQVFDSVGRLVFSKEQPGNSIDISAVPSGMYFLKITEGENVYSARVVKE